MSDPIPAGWTEVERPPPIVGKYDPRPPTIFEHAERGVAVHVLPDATRPTGAGVGGDAWRVGLVRGSATAFEAVEPVAEAVESRERALALARQVMRAVVQQPELPLGELATRIRRQADPRGPRGETAPS